MPDQFRDAEATFAQLRERFEAQEITSQEFADSLRQLRIKDNDGRFWVIGAESGKWYAYENGEWIERRPPSLAEKKAICIACGFENDLEAEFCARCGRRPDDSAPDGPDRPDAPGPEAEAAAVTAPAGALVSIRSVDVLSFVWFFGVLGLFSGILLGLLAGVTGLFAGFVGRLPAFFVEHRGDLLGGLACSFFGGLFGFVLGAAGGALAALVSNGILSLVGGVRFRRS
ncbi:MAG: zinc ribbon domain-containing protein [Acidobacteriota bacterium]